jgi:uncharacterized protein (DUF488 family)
MKIISTIGYEGADIDAFVYTLGAAGVELVIDVREIAASRRPGFSKNALREHLALADVSYTHLRNLGDPKEGREAARRGDYDAFRRVFFSHLASDAAQTELTEAVRLASKNAVALLCYERDPRECHRSIVANAMAEQNAFAIRHLGVQSGRRIAVAKATEGEFVRVR